MPSTYEPIATQTLGSAAATVTFSSIPSTYTDLVLIQQGTRSAVSNIYIQVGNGSIDTGSNYSLTFLRGSGSAAASGRSSNLSNGFFIDYDGGSPSTIETNILNFMNYSNTTTFKTVLSRTNNTGAEAGVAVNLWRSTSAINQIKIWCANDANLATGSTFTLYGIKAA